MITRRLSYSWWVLPIMVGVFGGVVGATINYSVLGVWEVFYSDALHTPVLFPIFLFTGLALSYFLVHLLAWYRTPKSSFHSILEVYHLSPSGLMPREAAVKTVSGIVTCAFGGSAGLEGASTIATGGFSVWLSKAVKTHVQPQKALMIGVAAGFAAVFKTPLAGLLFAIELPYRKDLDKDAFVEAALSSSTAYLASVALGAPSLLPDLNLKVAPATPWVLPLCLAFGFATGGAILAFTSIYKGAEEAAKRLIGLGGYPLILIAGGLSLGGVGYLAPTVTGSGSQMALLLAAGGFSTLAGILVAKMLATALTNTFGGGGGLFLPTLLMGGAWGAAVGSLLFPEHQAILILMGMAGFSAGVHKMMLMPVVFVAEVFGTHTIIPVILATVVAYLVSSGVSFYPVQPHEKHSEEELALERFYHKVSRRRVKELEKRTAAEVMTRKPLSLKASMTVREAFEAFSKTPFRIMPVTDDEGKVSGYVSLEELAFLTKTSLGTPLGETELHEPLLFKERTTVMTVIEDMIQTEEDHCYVVDEKERLVGVISTIDAVRLLMRFYTQ